MATYYVDGAVGSDANAGTSEGAGNAWATIDKAMNTVVAADKVWVKASATYAETATIDTAGTSTNIIVFEGYTTTTGDGGQVTIDGSALTNCLATTVASSTRLFYVFKNFIFTSADDDCVDLAANRHATFKNCRFTGAGASGCDLGNEHAFEACEFDSNSSNGCDSGFFSKLIACEIHGNGLHQVSLGGSSVVFNCVLYAPNALGQLIFFGTTNGGVVLNCTCDAENIASRCVDGGGGTQENGVIVVNTIAYDSADSSGAIVMDADQGEFIISRNNLLNSNTSNYSNYATHSGEVTSAPSFTDEASADYTLQSGSPAKAAGIDAGEVVNGVSYIDIGAHQREEPAGGGGAEQTQTESPTLIQVIGMAAY